MNGVALTSRKFDEFARSRGFPFFSCHAGPATDCTIHDDYVRFEIASSTLLVGVEKDLSFDALFFRHTRSIETALRRFRPDLIHVTGPNHTSILGALMSNHLDVPMTASWHTNVHEYAGRRLESLLKFLPTVWRGGAGRAAQSGTLAVLMRLYRCARVCFAPNPELVDMLERHTGRPAYLMQRGIDTSQFSPVHRRRDDSALAIGYVGRLSTEKNVRLLADLEQALIRAGMTDVSWW